MWSRSAPCLVFDEDAVRGALRDLGPTSDGAEAGAIAMAANLPLLKLLCSWRQHVRQRYHVSSY